MNVEQRPSVGRRVFTVVLRAVFYALLPSAIASFMVMVVNAEGAPFHLVPFLVWTGAFFFVLGFPISLINSFYGELERASRTQPRDSSGPE